VLWLAPDYFGFFFNARTKSPEDFLSTSHFKYNYALKIEQAQIGK